MFHTSKDIHEMLETINGYSGEEQERAIKSYFALNNALTKFFQWYCAFNNSELVSRLEYQNTVKHKVELVNQLNDLSSSFYRYPVDVQKKILERLLSKLTEPAMMFLENCLTKDIKSYYSNINREYINTKYNFTN